MWRATMSESMENVFKAEVECLRKENKHLLDILSVKDKEADRTDEVIIELVKMLRFCREKLNTEVEILESIDRTISKVYEI